MTSPSKCGDNPECDDRTTTTTGTATAKRNSTPSRPSVGEASASREQSFLPIAQLSTFTVKWTIKARLIEKSYQNFTRNSTAGSNNSANKSSTTPTRTGSGSLLVVDLMDIDGDVIRAKFWDDAADKWSPVLEKEKIFTFKGGRVQVANKRYNNTPHCYELTFSASSHAEILPCAESDTNDATAEDPSGGTSESGDGGKLSVPLTPARVWPKKRKEPSGNFMSLRDIKSLNREMPFLINVLAVVHSVSPVEEITSRKSGELFKRRMISVVDSSEHELEVTLWMPHAAAVETTALEGHPAVAIRNLQIRQWRGRVGATTSMTTLTFDPELDSGEKLLSWYQQNAKSIQFEPLKNENAPLQQLSNATGGNETIKEATLAEVYDEVSELNPGTEARLYSLKAQTSKFYYLNKENAFVGLYKACPKCRKKLSEDDNEFGSRQLRCEYCNTSVDPTYRYMVALSLTDHTRGRFIVRAFHEPCMTLLKTSALDIKKLSDNRNKDYEINDGGEGVNESEDKENESSKSTGDQKLSEIFEYDALWERVKFIIRGRREVYNGNSRNNVTIASCEKLNLEQHALVLLRDIWTHFPEARKRLRIASSVNSVSPSHKRSLVSSECLSPTAEKPMLENAGDEEIETRGEKRQCVEADETEPPRKIARMENSEERIETEIQTAEN